LRSSCWIGYLFCGSSILILWWKRRWLNHCLFLHFWKYFSSPEDTENTLFFNKSRLDKKDKFIDYTLTLSRQHPILALISG
jgi:hypothetical protein